MSESLESLEMSPISAEMNGNVTGKEMSSKSILEDSSADGSSSSNFSGSDSQPNSARRPLTTSTPIADQSHEENEPSSSTGSNSGGSVPKFGTKVPNRIFVGGISCQTTEEELLLLFARFGSVRATKIILDRAGVSKGYGFVTFETEEEAKRLCIAMDRKEIPPIIHRERRLNIAPAVKKQVFEPMARPNIPYSCQGDTITPPPLYGNGGGGFYYNQHQPPQHTEFYCPSAPIPEPFYSQTASYPQSHLQQQSTAPMHSYFNNGAPPPAAAPNGTIFYIPVQVPPSYQQTGSGQEQWTGTSAANFNTNATNSILPQQWRFHSTSTLPSMPLPPNPYSTCPGLHSTQSQNSPSHQFLQDQYNSIGLGHATTGGSFGPTDLYFINPNLISSPH